VIRSEYRNSAKCFQRGTKTAIWRPQIKNWEGDKCGGEQEDQVLVTLPNLKKTTVLSKPGESEKGRHDEEKAGGDRWRNKGGTGETEKGRSDNRKFQKKTQN